jgi:uncharacterized Zn finger protein (UPF0148 family)
MARKKCSKCGALAEVLVDGKLYCRKCEPKKEVVTPVEPKVVEETIEIKQVEEETIDTEWRPIDEDKITEKEIIDVDEITKFEFDELDSDDDVIIEKIDTF